MNNKAEALREMIINSMESYVSDCYSGVNEDSPVKNANEILALCAEAAGEAVEIGHDLDKASNNIYEDGFFDGINFSINEINKAFGVSDE